MALEENNPSPETDDEVRAHLLRLQDMYPDHITQASKDWLASHPKSYPFTPKGKHWVNDWPEAPSAEERR